MGARVLVIEDNPANLELMAYLLRACGFDVLSAVDGEAGLALAQVQKPDMIICDIQLPKLNGYEVARRLKSGADTRSIPVIAVTAFAMEGDKQRALTAGFDGYIGKPIELEEFVRELERLAPGAGALRAGSELAAAGVQGQPNFARGVRIVAVDDTPANLKFLVSLFAPLGYEVTTFPDVASALASARARPPDLIISDVHMPVQSGFDFLVEVRGDPVLGSVPFVLVSATLWLDSAGKQAADLGADLLLVRPVDPETLLKKVQAVLSGRVAADRASSF
jgi:two-component system cell cycle response regulator